MDKVMKLQPAMVIPVGEYIRDQMNALGFNQKNLARMIGKPHSVVNNILMGKRGINAEYAMLFATALDMDAEYLMRLQNYYDFHKERLDAKLQKKLEYMTIWQALLTFISENFFKKNGILTGDVIHDVDAVFRVFDIRSIDDMIKLRAEDIVCASSYYKKSERLQEDEKDIFSWRYYCYYQASKSKLKNDFDKKNESAIIADLRNVFQPRVTKIEEKVKKILNFYGINFYVIPKFGKIPIDGMSFWRGKNPTIILTKRKQNIDNFVFSLFHELGHLILHLKYGDITSYINNANEKCLQEEEANLFARKSIIDGKDWKT